MKKQLAAMAAAFLLMTGTACAADGGVEGKVKGPLDLGVELVVRDSGRGNWDRGQSGVGVAIGGEKKKTENAIELQLISRATDMNALSEAELLAWYKDGIAPTGADIFIAKADENGKYAFTGIPEGSYFLVILMPGGGELSGEADKSSDAAELQKFLRAWDMYQLSTIGMKLYSVQTIDIKPDHMVQYNYDYNVRMFQERKNKKS